MLELRAGPHEMRGRARERERETITKRAGFRDSTE